MNHQHAPHASPEEARWASLIIRASAGTGKTYHLSNRYLQLLLAGQSADRILATTFTRKAAGEILQRVVYRLAVAASDDAKCAELADRLKWDGLKRDHCQDVLRRMTRQLHRVRIVTLDSFFLQVARTLSLELGLPPSWQIVDEHEEQQIRDQAITALLQQEESQTVLQLMHWLTQGDAGRRVHDLLDDTVAAAYQVYLESPATAWKCLSRSKELEAAQLAEILQQLRQLQPPAHKKIQQAHQKDLERAEAGDWPALLKTGIGSRIAADHTQYYGVDLPETLVRVYQQLMDHARVCVLNRIVSQNEGTYELLQRFDQHHAAIQLQRRAMRFSDVARWLVRLEHSAHLDHLPFRLDASVDSLLLDEFQDTALVQWQVIRPFARLTSAATPQRSFLCVGDVKQAIYGWRGGDADLLDAVGDELGNTQPQHLDISFRSSPEIIAAVNTINQGMSQHPNLGESAAAVERWCREFPLHDTARKNLAGWVMMETAAAADEEQSQAEMTLQAAATRVQQLVQQTPDQSLAVLVRTNASVGRLINLLRSQGVAASGEGGNPLTDSAAVGLVLSLLQLADHPGDTVARFHLAKSPWGEVLGLSDHGDADAAAALARQVREQLADVGYGAALVKWARQLRPYCDTREWRRLCQLVELGVHHQTRLETPRQVGYHRQNRLSPRTTAFTGWVQQQRVADPSADRVRVMTVHQSKGLQFDVVVLPELDRRPLSRTPYCVVHRPAATEPIDAVCRYAPEALRRLLPERVQRVFAGHFAAQTREELCVLYVALTRAIRGLHLIVAPSAPAEKRLPGTLAGMIRAAVTDQQLMPPESVVYQLGSPPETEGVASGVTTCAREPVVASPPVMASHTRSSSAAAAETLADPPRRGMEITAPSALEGDGRVRLGDRLSRPVSRAMERGTLIHAFFEQLEWLEQGLPDEPQLLQVARRLDAEESHVESALRAFRAAIARPSVAGLLSRAHYQAWLDAARATATGTVSLQVRREQPLAVRLDDTILSGSIDRLILLCEAERPLAAEVIDFKTDAVPTPQRLSQLVAHYRPQLQAYVRGVGRMLRLEPQQISAQLLFLSSGDVVEVNGRSGSPNQ